MRKKHHLYQWTTGWQIDFKGNPRISLDDVSTAHGYTNTFKLPLMSKTIHLQLTFSSLSKHLVCSFHRNTKKACFPVFYICEVRKKVLLIFSVCVIHSTPEVLPWNRGSRPVLYSISCLFHTKLFFLLFTNFFKVIDANFINLSLIAAV